MALINRIEISNFLNITDAEPWTPSYRHVEYILGGQATAIQMDNGIGKTSIAEAIMTVLSRNSKFARNTLDRMAPLTSTSPFGAYYSHIRIEFVVRDNEPTDDFFTLAGEDVPGETWVFGICGNRRERGINDPGLKYYCYSGKLKDCPVADTAKNALITNEAFRTTLRDIRGSSWDVGAEEWHDRVHEMLPKHVIHQLVEFQKAGAGDASADLYNVTVLRDPKTKKEIESFEEAFFRKMVASELLAGAMGDEADDNEWFFEETIEASLRKLVDASRKTRNRLSELQDARSALDEMKPVKAAAVEAEDAVIDFRDASRKIAQEVVLLTDLVDRDPLPGIPYATQPLQGLAGALARNIVIVPGDFPGKEQFVLLAQGFREISDADLNDINQTALREKLDIAASLSQVIDYKCGLSVETPGHKPNGYALDSALSLVAKLGKLKSGINRESAQEAIKQAFSWFVSMADTNPYRLQARGISAEIKAIEGALETLNSNFGKNEQAIAAAQGAMQQFSHGQVVFDQMRSSKLFTDEEMHAPGVVGQTIEEAYKKADRELRTFEQRHTELQLGYQAWNRYQQAFPGSDDPATCLAALMSDQQAARDIMLKARNYLEQLQHKLRLATQETNRLELAYSNAQIAVERLDEYAPSVSEYQKLFCDEKPDVVSTNIKAKLAAAQQFYKDCQDKLDTLQTLEEKRQEYNCNEKFCGISPDTWLENSKTKREQLFVQKSESGHRLDSLLRQLEELKDAKLSTPSIVLDAIKDVPKYISMRPLHEVIASSIKDETKRNQAMTLFSTVMFAPVVSNADNAAIAAEAIHGNGFGETLPVPVFIEGPLLEYLSGVEITLKELEGHKLACTFLAGVETLAVQAALNPDHLPEVIKCVEADIQTHRGKLKTIEDDLRELDPDGFLIVLANEARKAIQANLPDSLVSASEQRETAKISLNEVEATDTETVRDLISAMKGFLKAGGDVKRNELANNLAQIAPEREAASANKASLELQESEATIARDVAEQSFKEVEISHEAQSMLKDAVKFVSEDGPHFMKDAKSKNHDLETKRQTADNRRKFDFSVAQQYLDETKSGGIEQLQSSLQVLLDKKQELQQEKANKSSEQQSKNAKIAGIQESAFLLDQAILALLKQYRQISRIRDELPQGEAIRPESDSRWELADRMRMAIIAMNSSNQMCREFRQEMEEMRIDDKAKEARRMHNKVRTTSQEFSTRRDAFIAACRNGRIRGLSPSELSNLAEIKDNYPAVAILAEEIFKSIEKNEEIFQKASQDEQILRHKTVERLAKLANHASNNLAMLKKVLNETPQATFRVEVTIASQDENERFLSNLGSAMETRLEGLDREISQLGIIGNTSSYGRDDMLAWIRQQSHQHLFREASIKVIHPDIRGGKPFSLTNESKISKGQKSAIALMWTAKMAQFAMERSIGSQVPGKYRSRARSKSETVLIVDGLFSNLSRRALIDEAMQSFRHTKGHFQLIGLIHEPAYANDYDVFPTYIKVRPFGAMDNPDRSRCWIKAEHWKHDGIQVKDGMLGEIAAVSTHQRTK